jgi:hypothetical protein
MAALKTATARIREGAGRIKSGTSHPRQANSQTQSKVTDRPKENSEERLFILQVPINWSFHATVS